MTNLQILALIFSVTALAGYINHRFIRLPYAIGMMALSLTLSLAVFTLGKFGLFDTSIVAAMVAHIDFSNIFLHGMLSFLLFAGALHINVTDLRKVRLTVALLATGGVVLAVIIGGSLVWLAAALLGIPLSPGYALLFGALIAPTDPIAVLGILKNANVPRRLYMKIGGESLFNDGTAIVVFTLMLGMTMPSQQQPDIMSILLLFAREVLGGGALGLAAGWATHRLIRGVNEYKIEVLLTLALVTAGHALAEMLHVSAPITMVVAGLFIGNHGRAWSSADRQHRQLDAFWEMLDEVLNAVLFMLIGLQMVLVVMTPDILLIGGAAILATLAGRYLSVAALVSAMRLGRQRFERGTITLLTWGALRGGVSIALALSLPDAPEKNIVLDMTFVVVVFSILVQGTSFGRVIAWATRPRHDHNLGKGKK